MAILIIQHVILTVVICSMTSHATEVSRTYKLQVSSTGSKVCSVDKPSTVIPMTLRAMRIQCGGKCNEASLCTQFQMREDLQQCQLYNYSTSNFAAVNHCTSYAAPKVVPKTPTLVATLTGTQGVLATALLNDQLFITRVYDTTVSVYSTSTFQKIRTISISGLGIIVYGMATSAIDNCLLVADFNNNYVHRVNLSVTGTVSEVVWRPTPLNGNTQALSVTSGNNVLLTTTNGGSRTIKEYTPSGSLVRIITTATNNDPWQAVEVDTDTWAFSSAIGNQICTTLTNGTMIKCFGSAAGPGLTLAMYGPRGVAYDTSGYILVADQNNKRVLVVDRTLTSARVLQLPVSPALTSVWSLSYDQPIGRLYVGEYGGERRVLVFDGIWL